VIFGRLAVISPQIQFFFWRCAPYKLLYYYYYFKPICR